MTIPGQSYMAQLMFCVLLYLYLYIHYDHTWEVIHGTVDVLCSVISISIYILWPYLGSHTWHSWCSVFCYIYIYIYIMTIPGKSYMAQLMFCVLLYLYLYIYYDHTWAVIHGTVDVLCSVISISIYILWPYLGSHTWHSWCSVFRFQDSSSLHSVVQGHRIPFCACVFHYHTWRYRNPMAASLTTPRLLAALKTTHIIITGWHLTLSLSALNITHIIITGWHLTLSLSSKHNTHNYNRLKPDSLSLSSKHNTHYYNRLKPDSLSQL